MMLPDEISQSIKLYLSGIHGTEAKITTVQAIGGGCINNACKISDNDRSYFVKYNLSDHFPGMFQKEAAGLGLISKTQEIRVPGVLENNTIGRYSYLLLEFIKSGNKNKNFWIDFGRAVASLHRRTGYHFGLDEDNYIGSLVQSNRKHPDWAGFFISERLEPMIKMAFDQGKMERQLILNFERLSVKLSDYFPPERPALLHGDLWNGNFMVDDDGNPCLIDPAVYYGHREADLAMTRLFGGFSNEFYFSYNDHFPLEKGWPDRTDLFNLYPLLVHVNLFGGGYISDVRRILDRFT